VTGNPARSYFSIFLFWIPLAAQWVMMAVEGPFLAAIIARLGDPAYNLAAYGVAFAFAILIESPVIMLMSASTALVEDTVSYRRLRNFANALNAGSTLLLVLMLLPPVYDTIMSTLLGLPDPVADLVYGALWILLPWPAAIGYRRFLHGVLIRSGRTRLVAYGTVLRLAAMAGTALALYTLSSLPGAWVGAAALSAGVCIEALATRVMAIRALRELPEPMTRPESTTGSGMTTNSERATSHVPDSGPHYGYREIIRFYYPLALTSFIGLAVHPLLTFFMGRSPAPVESLAVFPVVHALSFLFRAFGFSYQEAAIALLGRNQENVRIVARFGAGMAVAASGGFALVTFTPLAGFWFETVSGLPPDLAAVAITPARVLTPLPALAVLLALQQGILVQGRATRAITAASAIEVALIALLFPLFAWGFGMIGVTAAMLALLGGRASGNLYLAMPVRAVLRSARARVP
jgi:progressive ankylosis protein